MKDEKIAVKDQQLNQPDIRISHNHPSGNQLEEVRCGVDFQDCQQHGPAAETSNDGAQTTNSSPTSQAE